MCNQFIHHTCGCSVRTLYSVFKCILCTSIGLNECAMRTLIFCANAAQLSVQLHFFFSEIQQWRCCFSFTYYIYRWNRAYTFYIFIFYIIIIHRLTHKTNVQHWDVNVFIAIQFNIRIFINWLLSDENSLLLNSNRKWIFHLRNNQ